jgi:PAS domain-containing protein/DNA-binding HxlR family transcriptional regulator
MTEKRTSSANLTLLRQQAEEQLKVKKKIDYSASPDDMQRIIHELAVYQIELEMQQDELLQARAELEESLDCYTELYDFAPLGYLTLDREGTITKVNLSGSKLLGVDRSHLMGGRLAVFIAPEDLTVFNALLERVSRTRDHDSCEVKLPSHATSSCSTDSSASGNAMVFPNRTVRIDAVVSNDSMEFRVVISDISMQKQVERENKLLMIRLIQARRNESIDGIGDVPASDFNHQLLDKIIHSRIRFAALSYLFSVDQACFVEIKKKVRTTDGNLSVHMRMLESAEYIICDKDVKSRKPQTIYRITQKGHEAFIKYKASLTSFLIT